MRITKAGKRNLHDWSAQDFAFIPTPPADHMLETADEFLVRLGQVERKFQVAYPVSPLADVLTAIEKLRQFCQSHRQG